MVALEEGFGNREWLWFPSIPQDELEAWWISLENVETFWNEQTRQHWPGDFILVGDDLGLSELWTSLWENGPVRVRVDTNEVLNMADPETYLRRSDGTLVLHQGAVGAEPD